MTHQQENKTRTLSAFSHASAIPVIELKLQYQTKYIVRKQVDVILFFFVTEALNSDHS